MDCCRGLGRRTPSSFREKKDSGSTDVKDLMEAYAQPELVAATNRVSVLRLTSLLFQDRGRLSPGVPWLSMDLNTP